jgi:hypothetical protein
MAPFEHRRRPKKYTLSQRRRFSELIREHGARGTRELLSRQICLSTLLEIAREFGIGLKKGKRPRAA